MSGQTPLPSTELDLPLLPLRTADGGPNDSLVAAHAAISVAKRAKDQATDKAANKHA